MDNLCLKEEQIKLADCELDKKIPSVPFLESRGIIPAPIYDTYWFFATERQNIFVKRKTGAAYPWTNDPVLLKFKFTNPYRASDRVSQYLIKNVIYCGGIGNLYSPEDTFFRIILFKLFNRIETWEFLERKIGPIEYRNYSFERISSCLNELLENNRKIYSAAYIMPSGTSFGFPHKHENNIKLLELMMSEHVVAKIAKLKNLKELYELLISYPSLGKFLAFQYAIDINYSELCDFSEMDFVVAGPGAQSGITKLFLDTNGYSDEYIIRLMAENQESEFERLSLKFNYLGSRRLQLIDCQNLFCETDKYTRVAFPEYKGNNRTRIKQHFIPNLAQPIEYYYPPKWGIM
ncbi:MAG: nucleotide kinase domain-containing protein [Candidatus Ornithomonoglobus sp.]